MRLVIFTTYDIKETDWWPIIDKTPGLEEVLVCRKILPNDVATVFRRLFRNIKVHGLVFIPYRLYHIIKNIYTRFINRNRNGKESVENPTKISINLIESEDIHAKDVLDRVKTWNPDLGLSIGAPILRQKLFSIPTMGTINVHCAKLPDYRGAPPGFWEVREGATEIGASVHWMDEGLDTGDIIASATASIYENDRVSDVQKRALELGRLVLEKTLKVITEGKLEGTKQNEGGSTFKQPLVREKIKVHIQNLFSRYKYWNKRRGRWVKLIVSLGLLILYRPISDSWYKLKGRHPIRFFTFHRVTNLCRDGMTVSPDIFAKQIKYILKHYKVISAREAIELLSDGKSLRYPYAVITFDDGYSSVFNSAFPIMKQAGVTGCCFVSTDLVNSKKNFKHDLDSPIQEFLGVMSWDELQHLQEEGWDIGAHSATHARMSELKADKLDYEVITPMNTLKQKLGMEKLMVAYPFGLAEDVPDNWQDIVRNAGYIANFSDIMGENYPGDDLYDLARIELGGDHASLGWKVRVHGINLAQYRNISMFRK